MSPLLLPCNRIHCDDIVERCVQVQRSVLDDGRRLEGGFRSAGALCCQCSCLELPSNAQSGDVGWCDLCRCRVALPTSITTIGRPCRPPGRGLLRRRIPDRKKTQCPAQLSSYPHIHSLKRPRPRHRHRAALVAHRGRRQPTRHYGLPLVWWREVLPQRREIGNDECLHGSRFTARGLGADQMRGLVIEMSGSGSGAALFQP